MSKILKINNDKIVIGLDNGKVKTVNKLDLNFEPQVNDEVEIFESDNECIVSKKNSAKNQSNAANAQSGVNININNQNNAPGVYQTVETYGGAWSWIIGICFIFTGIGIGASGLTAAGILYILYGVLILPPICKLIHKYTKFKIVTGLKVLLWLILMVVTIPLIAMEGDQSNVNSNKTEDAETINYLYLNQPVDINNFNVELISVEIKSSFTIKNDNYFLNRDYKADEGKQYVIARLKCKNIATETKVFNGTFDSNYNFELLCNDKYEYSVTVSEKDLSYSSSISIEPLETKEIYLYADVPDEAMTEKVIGHFKMDGKMFTCEIK